MPFGAYLRLSGYLLRFFKQKWPDAYNIGCVLLHIITNIHTKTAVAFDAFESLFLSGGLFANWNLLQQCNRKPAAVTVIHHIREAIFPQQFFECVTGCSNHYVYFCAPNRHLLGERCEMRDLPWSTFL